MRTRRGRISWWLVDRANRIRLHQALGALMVLLGVALLVSPTFAFGGDLAAVSMTVAELYAVPFLVCGALLWARRPPTVWRYYALLSPLMFHYAANVAQVVNDALNYWIPGGQVGNLRLLPVVPLYLTPFAAVYYLLRQQYDDVD